MEFIEDTVIDLSELCSDMQDAYSLLKPYMKVVVRKYIPGAGSWVTRWELVEDELVVTEEGLERSVFLGGAPVIEGTLADVHKRITIDRLSVLMSYTDYAGYPVLWKALIESEDINELVTQLDTLVPDDVYSSEEDEEYDEHAALIEALDRTKHHLKYQYAEMLERRLKHFDHLDDLDQQVSSEEELSEDDEDGWSPPSTIVDDIRAARLRRFLV